MKEFQYILQDRSVKRISKFKILISIHTYLNTDITSNIQCGNSDLLHTALDLKGHYQKIVLPMKLYIIHLLSRDNELR